MTDRAALLAAILKNPADDGLRLVYADALDEADGGASPRAEFIRVQVELTGYEEMVTDQVRADHWWSLKRRERAVRRSTDAEMWHWYHGVCWPPSRFEWSRGFVSHVTCSAADWLAHAAAILAAHPVERVTLTTAPYLGWDWPPPRVDDPDDGVLRFHRWPGVEFTLPGAGALDYERYRDYLTAEIGRGLGVPQHLLSPARDIRHTLAEAAAARFGASTAEVEIVGDVTPQPHIRPGSVHIVCPCSMRDVDYAMDRYGVVPPAAVYAATMELRLMPAYLTAGGVAYRWACGRCPACHRVYATARPTGVVMGVDYAGGHTGRGRYGHV